MARRITRRSFQNDTWFNTKWRPAMAWTYMAICILDFAVFPILWSLLQAYKSGQVTSQWVPITLQGAGLFHMSMGAILGISAWTRGKEKEMMLAQPISSPQPYIPQPQPVGSQPFKPQAPVTVVGSAPEESPIR